MSKTLSYTPGIHTFHHTHLDNAEKKSLSPHHTTSSHQLFSLVIFLQVTKTMRMGNMCTSANGHRRCNTTQLMLHTNNQKEISVIYKIL